MRNEYSSNKGKIVRTAIRLFNEKGYESVSVSEICKAAGTYRSSFYNVFSCKEDILIAIHKDTIHKIDISATALLEAENDFERLWLLSEEFLRVYMDLGYGSSSYIFIMELAKNYDIVDTIINDLSKWYKLIESCQKQGLVHNQSDPHMLQRQVTYLGLFNLYEWCRSKGTMDMKTGCRRSLETLLDAATEIRWP